MNIPDRNRHWKKEVEKALSSAEKRADKEGLEIEFIYKYAVDFIVNNRKISDGNIIQEIAKSIDLDIKHNREGDPDSKLNYKFSFVSSYLYGHVIAGLIDEMELDRVMDYVNANMDLFHLDYDH